MLPKAGQPWDWHQAGGHEQEQQQPLPQDWQQQDDLEGMPLSTDDFYDLRDQADDLHRQLQSESTARAAAEQESDQLRCEKGHLSLRVKALEREADAQGQHGQELVLVQEKRRNEVRQLESSVASAEALLDLSKLQVSEIQGKLAESDTNLAAAKDDLSDTRGQLADARSQLSQKESDESEQFKIKSDLKQERDDAIQQTNKSRNETDSLRSQLVEMSSQNSGDADLLESLQQQVEAARSVAAEAAKAQERLQKAHEEAHSESRSLQLQLRELRDENSRLTNGFSEAQKLAELSTEMGEQPPTLTPAEVVFLQEEVRRLTASGESLEKRLQQAQSESDRLRISMSTTKITKVEQAGMSVADGIERAKLSLKKAQERLQPEAPVLKPQVEQQTTMAAPLAAPPARSAVSKQTRVKEPVEAEGLAIVSASVSEPQSVVIANRGSTWFNLEGCTVVDNVGKSKPSTRLTIAPSKNNPGPFDLAAGESMVFWLTPGRTSTELDLQVPNPFHFYGTTVAGGLNKAAMLQDPTDPIILKDPKGQVLSRIVPAECSDAQHAQALADVVVVERTIEPTPKKGAKKAKETKPVAKRTKESAAAASRNKATAKSKAAVLKITSISAADPEHMVITNQGDGAVDLQGYTIVDNVDRSTKSNRFVLAAGKNNPGPFVLQPGKTLTFWFSAGRGGVDLKSKKSPQHVFATTKSGSIRKQAVLNDDGDKVALLDTDEKVVCEILTGLVDMDVEEEEEEESEASEPSIEITSISAADPEHMVITNQGDVAIDLEDYTVVDNVGKAKESNRFALAKGKLNPGPFVLKPHESMTFWFSAGRVDDFDFDTKTNPRHFIGTTKSGALRKQAVVNDDGDTIVLKDVKGNTVAQIVAEGKSVSGKKRPHQQADLPASKRAR